jgi:hypothetical protein
MLEFKKPISRKEFVKKIGMLILLAPFVATVVKAQTIFRGDTFITAGGTSSQYVMGDGSLSSGGGGGSYVPLSGGTMTGDLITTDVVLTRSGVVNRDSNGYITSVAKTGGRTITPTRDSNGFITSLTDGTRTWTLTRDADNLITAWTVS